MGCLLQINKQSLIFKEIVFCESLFFPFLRKKMPAKKEQQMQSESSLQWNKDLQLKEK